MTESDQILEVRWVLRRYAATPMALLAAVAVSGVCDLLLDAQDRAGVIWAQCLAVVALGWWSFGRLQRRTRFGQLVARSVDSVPASVLEVRERRAPASLLWRRSLILTLSSDQVSIVKVAALAGQQLRRCRAAEVVQIRGRADVIGPVAIVHPGGKTVLLGIGCPFDPDRLTLGAWLLVRWRSARTVPRRIAIAAVKATSTMWTIARGVPRLGPALLGSAWHGVVTAASWLPRLLATFVRAIASVVLRLGMAALASPGLLRRVAARVVVGLLAAVRAATLSLAGFPRRISRALARVGQTLLSGLAELAALPTRMARTMVRGGRVAAVTLVALSQDALRLPALSLRLLVHAVRRGRDVSSRGARMIARLPGSILRASIHAATRSVEIAKALVHPTLAKRYLGLPLLLVMIGSSGLVAGSTSGARGFLITATLALCIGLVAAAALWLLVRLVLLVLYRALEARGGVTGQIAWYESEARARHLLSGGVLAVQLNGPTPSLAVVSVLAGQRPDDLTPGRPVELMSVSSPPEGPVVVRCNSTYVLGRARVLGPYRIVAEKAIHRARTILRRRLLTPGIVSLVIVAGLSVAAWGTSDRGAVGVWGVILLGALAAWLGPRVEQCRSLHRLVARGCEALSARVVGCWIHPARPGLPERAELWLQVPGGNESDYVKVELPTSQNVLSLGIGEAVLIYRRPDDRRQLVIVVAAQGLSTFVGTGAAWTVESIGEPMGSAALA